MKRILILSMAALLGPVAWGQNGVTVADVHVNRENRTVHVGFRLDVPADAVRRDYKLILTPVLYNGSNELKLEPVIVETRRTRLLDARHRLSSGQPCEAPAGIATLPGNSVRYTRQAPFERWMHEADIRIEQRLIGCCTERPLESIAAARNLALRETPKPVIAPVRPELRIETVNRRWDFSSREMIVDFAVNRSTIDPALFDNQTTLREIVEVARNLSGKPGTALTLIKITGNASPEGDPKRNEELAGARSAALRNYLQAQVSGLGDDKFELFNEGINWRGLREMVAASDMAKRDEVLDILDHAPIWNSERNEGRHGMLMRLDGGRPYRYMLEHFFPKLRNACYVEVYYDVLNDLAADTINEAVSLIRAGRYAEASARLEPLKDDPRAWNAIGVCYMMTEQYAPAREYFRKASAGGDANAEKNLGVLDDLGV